jgi:AraC-like DNA-binding protein
MKHSSLGECAVRISYARTLLDYLEAQGLSQRDVLAGLGLEHMDLWEEQGRMPMAQWQTWLRAAMERLGDEALPLRLAGMVRPRHLGLLGFLSMSCATLGDAIQVLERYELLLDNVNEAVCAANGNAVHLEWRPLFGEVPAPMVQMSLGTWVQQARLLTERYDLWCEAHFTFEAPSSEAALAAYRQTFGGPVLFGQAVNHLVFPQAYLSLPVVQRDVAVHVLLREQAERELSSLALHDRDFLRRLELLVEQQLDQGELNLTLLARLLGVTPRTLQHRLNCRGLSYRELLDRVRCRLAEQHLRDARLTLAEVAGLLGFADQSSFQHAFKRWTGRSPGEFRRGEAGVEASYGRTG